MMASNSASAVHGAPAGKSLLRSLSCLLHKASDASTKCNSCSALARSNSSRNQARCALVLPGKSSTTEMSFDKRAQTCGPSAFFNREEHLTNQGERHFLAEPNLSRAWTSLPPFCRTRKSTSLRGSCLMRAIGVAKSCPPSFPPVEDVRPVVSRASVEARAFRPVPR